MENNYDYLKQFNGSSKILKEMLKSAEKDIRSLIKELDIYKKKESELQEIISYVDERINSIEKNNTEDLKKLISAVVDMRSLYIYIKSQLDRR